jgi:hypothetical protein
MTADASRLQPCIHVPATMWIVISTDVKRIRKSDNGNVHLEIDQAEMMQDFRFSETPGVLQKTDHSKNSARGRRIIGCLPRSIHPLRNLLIGGVNHLHLSSAVWFVRT